MSVKNYISIMAFLKIIMAFVYPNVIVNSIAKFILGLSNRNLSGVRLSCNCELHS